MEDIFSDKNRLSIKKIFWLVILIAVAGIILYVFGKENTAEPIGGQRDDHGCLITAGYSWCEARQTCERPWEKYCTAVMPSTVVFTCALGRNIRATFYPTDDYFVDLVLIEPSVESRALSVPRAISASGARYAKEDESFVFWNKGDTAFVTENGTTTFDECVRVFRRQ